MLRSLVLPTLLAAAPVLLLAALHGRRRRPAASAGEDAVRAAAADLPPGFRFGAATAAHQVEGGLANNWTRWEETTRPDGRPGIFTGDRVGRAAEHWERFDEDLTRMRALGLSMYRFSVEWSRVEPEEGRFDEAAIARYRSWCERLRAAGIEPVVTLHHFTEPVWITDRGGWEDRATVDAFARFVAHVVPRLADAVDWWVTVNEPAVYATMGWVRGEFPPGKQDPALMGRVLEHLLLAHGAAYERIHALDTADADGDGVPCRASIAKNIVLFEPRRWWHAGDVAAARVLDRTYNHAPLEALRTGRLRLRVPGALSHGADHPHLAGTLDYLGVNHYFRTLVRFDPALPHGMELGFSSDPGAVKNDMGWDVTPGSLLAALRRVRWMDRPILVTEHGTCDAATPDARRCALLADAFAALADARADGIDVMGYLHWSLLDNFEWAHGFGPRFGLYRVDYATQTRTLTDGGRLFGALIAAHRAGGARRAA